MYFDGHSDLYTTPSMLLSALKITRAGETSGSPGVSVVVGQ